MNFSGICSGCVLCSATSSKHERMYGILNLPNKCSMMLVMDKAEAISLIQFQKQFGIEDDCASYIMSKRWRNGFS
jgi:hypothetical protein